MASQVLMVVPVYGIREDSMIKIKTVCDQLYTSTTVYHRVPKNTYSMCTEHVSFGTLVEPEMPRQMTS